MEVLGLDHDIDDREFLLHCSDGDVTCTAACLERIPFLKSIEENDSEVKEITLSTISKGIMTKILEWVDYHKEEPKDLPMPLPHYDMYKLVGHWDAAFLKSFSARVLFFELVQAANYLGLTILTNYGCAETSIRFKDKTLDEACKLLEIENNFTPADIAKMEEEWNAFLGD